MLLIISLAHSVGTKSLILSEPEEVCVEDGRSCRLDEPYCCQGRDCEFCDDDSEERDCFCSSRDDRDCVIVPARYQDGCEEEEDYEDDREARTIRITLNVVDASDTSSYQSPVPNTLVTLKVRKGGNVIDSGDVGRDGLVELEADADRYGGRDIFVEAVPPDNEGFRDYMASHSLTESLEQEIEIPLSPDVK